MGSRSIVGIAAATCRSGRSMAGAGRARVRRHVAFRARPRARRRPRGRARDGLQGHGRAAAVLADAAAAPGACVPPEAPPDLPAPRPDLALSGVIAGGGAGVALVKRPQDAAPVRVVLGGRIDGWTVAEIHPRAVVLSRDARSVTVGLSPSPR